MNNKRRKFDEDNTKNPLHEGKKVSPEQDRGGKLMEEKARRISTKQGHHTSGRNPSSRHDSRGKS